MYNPAIKVLKDAIDAGVFQSRFDKRQSIILSSQLGSPETQSRPKSLYSCVVLAAANGLVDIMKSSIGDKVVVTSVRTGHGGNTHRFRLKAELINDHGSGDPASIFNPNNGSLPIYGLTLDFSAGSDVCETPSLGLVLQRKHSFRPSFGQEPVTQIVNTNEVTMVTFNVFGEIGSQVFYLGNAASQDARLDNAIQAASSNKLSLAQNLGHDRALEIALQSRYLGSYLNGIAEAAGPAE